MTPKPKCITRPGNVRYPASVVIDGQNVARGSVLPLPPRRLDVRPEKGGDNRPSFKPSRGPRK